MDRITKKLIRDYQYLLDTLEDIKEISVEAESTFRSALQKEDPEAIKALIPPELKEGEIPKPPPEKDKAPLLENEQKFKRLFRKAAVSCHPDRISKDASKRDIEFLKLCYENLTEANDNNDWGLLLKVAMELDIEFLELEEDEVSNINNKIKELRNTISGIENSMAYSWFSQSDEELKKIYLAECAKIFKKSLEPDVPKDSTD